MKKSVTINFFKTVKTVAIGSLLFIGTVVYSQTTTENYVQTTTFKTDEGKPADAFINITYYDGLGRPKQEVAHKQSGNGGDLITHIEYDGFGRQVKEFLPYERSSASLNIDGSSSANVHSFYNNLLFQNTTNPYSEKELENSPLGRVLRQASPGNDWAMDEDHEIRFDYQTNSSTEVYYFKVTTPMIIPTLAINSGNSGKYPENQLYKSIVKDENHPGTGVATGTVVEYKNKQGQVVLRRHYTTLSGYRDVSPGTPVALDTYYVYDNYGNLTFVLPPKLSEQIVSGSSLVSNHNELIDELGYRYKYDRRNRLIHKKLPGQQYQFMAYDPLDRVIATGPVPSPFQGEDVDGALHTRYDAFNRVVYTFWTEGTFDDTKRETIESSIGAATSESFIETPENVNGVSLPYTRDVAPQTSYILTKFAYDRYQIAWIPGSFPATILTQTVEYDHTKKPKGMPTGTWTRALEDRNSSNANTTYILYDKKARPIRAYGANYLGGYTFTDSKYDFIGKVLKTVTKHKRTAAEGEETVLMTTEEFTYTEEDRLEKHTHKINTLATQMLSYNTYDALGRLTNKKVGHLSESSYLQKVDYKYNVRGWLTDINNVDDLLDTGAPQDLFAFRIGYNTVTQAHADVEPLYNGNISQTFWRTASDNTKRSYGYVYDPINRLRDAWYKVPYSSVNNSYNEHLTYDSNGNILFLQRNGDVENGIGAFMIDDLAYDYDSGNKLINVTDVEEHSSGFDDDNDHTAAPFEDDFEYDDYGNLIKDRNKEIEEIVYNYLNLPKKITFENDDVIEYLYDASGTKLKKTVTEATTTTNTHYLDGFQYKEDKLSFFPTTEGYVNVTHSLTAALYNYVYNYTDHLGNIRLRYTKNPSITGPYLKILEEDHYYPFGLKHNGYNGEISVFEPHEPSGTVEIVLITPLGEDLYRYKFNGMELQTELGAEMYDFGFRNYDPAIGRWMNIDPLAEMMRRHSPYNFAFNNPIYFIDPDGMSPVGNTVASMGANTRLDWNFSGGFEVTTVGEDGTTDTKFVSSLKGTGLQEGWNEGADARNLGGDNGGKGTAALKGQVARSQEFIDQGLESLEGSDNSSGSGLNQSNRYLDTSASLLQSSSDNSDLNMFGPALLASGQPVNFLKPVGALRSKPGSSIASYLLSKALPQKLPFRLMGSTVLGRGLGRFIPVAGQSLLIYDAVKSDRMFDPALQGSRNMDKDIQDGKLNTNQMIKKYSCFIKGTKVQMADGSKKNIENIVIGDKILSVNIEKMLIEADIVVDIPNTMQEYPEIKAEFSNGIINYFSPAHPYWVKDKGWAVFDTEEAETELEFVVSQLERGDIVLFLENGNLVEVSITILEPTGKTIEMFNVEFVKKNHTFFANGILVHNKRID